MITKLDYLGNADLSPLTATVDKTLRTAVAMTGLDPDSGIYSIDGMSGKNYRYFINTLVRAVPDPRYLEIGSWLGSTLCSAVHGNKVTAYAIDNWSEFGGPKEKFLANLQKFLTLEAHATFIESDFRTVDYSRIPEKFNIYLFDGPHEEEDQYRGLASPLPCLADQFVFIVDDWNWRRVRTGTLAAIGHCGLTVLYAAQIRTTHDDLSPPHLLPVKDFREVRNFEWHNGYFISVLEKPPKAVPPA